MSQNHLRIDEGEARRNSDNSCPTEKSFESAMVDMVIPIEQVPEILKY